MPQARMECSQQAQTRSRRKTKTAMEVLKQRLNDVQSRVGATATRAHVESPLSTGFFVDSCSVKYPGNCCASTHQMPATWISSRTQGTGRCSCDNTVAFARCEHTWIYLRAQKGMFRRKDLLRSHAASTLGSHSVRKQTCSCDNRAAFARCEHTGISLRAQRGMFRRKDCCILTPRAHLDLSVHKETCSIEKTAAFSRREHIWISLRAQTDMFMRHTAAFARHKHTWISLRRKETCSGKTTAAFSRREHSWISFRAQRDMFHRKDCWDLVLPPEIDDFYLRTPHPVSTVKRVPVPYAIGNP